MRILIDSRLDKLTAPYTSLTNKYLPCYQFSEQHISQAITATTEEIIAQIKNYDERQDPVFRFLIKIREFPGRLLIGLGLTKGLKNREPFGFADFSLLEQTDTEIAYGLSGYFWRLNYGLIKIESASEFIDSEAICAPKLLMTFALIPTSAETYFLSTETRINCPTARLKWQFLPYWLVIRFFSGLIRQRILKRIKHAAEARLRR